CTEVSRRSGELFLPVGVGPAPEVAGDLRCFPAVVHAAPSAAAVLAVVDEQEPACAAWLDVAGCPVGQELNCCGDDGPQGGQKAAARVPCPRAALRDGDELTLCECFDVSMMQAPQGW